jgi:regulator of sigma E protease
LAARAAGVKVLSFSIGFGLGHPIAKWTDKRGTEWRIGWLPLGGYVELFGEKTEDGKVEKGHLKSVNRWKQAMIMAAGVVFNFILAWVVYIGIFAAKPEVVIKPVIGTVVENSLAAANGIKPDMKIISIAGEQIPEWKDLLKVKTVAGNDIVKVELQDGDAIKTVRLKADASWGIAPKIDEKPELKKRTFGGVIVRATSEVAEQSKLLFVVLKQIITGERDSKQLGSFVLIGQMAGDALVNGLLAILTLIAVLSINLGVVNLLPIPALDGGQLLILALEGITRRKFNEKAINWIMLISWFFLIGLMAYTLRNDIMRLFGM